MAQFLQLKIYVDQHIFGFKLYDTWCICMLRLSHWIPTGSMRIRCCREKCPQSRSVDQFGPTSDFQARCVNSTRLLERICVEIFQYLRFKTPVCKRNRTNVYRNSQEANSIIPHRSIDILWWDCFIDNAYGAEFECEQVELLKKIVKYSAGHYCGPFPSRFHQEHLTLANVLVCAKSWKIEYESLSRVLKFRRTKNCYLWQWHVITISVPSGWILKLSRNWHFVCKFIALRHSSRSGCQSTHLSRNLEINSKIVCNRNECGGFWTLNVVGSVDTDDRTVKWESRTTTNYYLKFYSSAVCYTYGIYSMSYHLEQLSVYTIHSTLSWPHNVKNHANLSACICFVSEHTKSYSFSKLSNSWITKHLQVTSALMRKRKIENEMETSSTVIRDTERKKPSPTRTHARHTLCAIYQFACMSVDCN